MAFKTPRTALREYLDKVSTDKGSRVHRRRSASTGPAPGSTTFASSPSSRRVGVARRSSPRTASPAGSMAVAEKNITPRYLIQSKLSVEGTAQPVTRKQRRVSDIGMPPPSGRVQRAAYRHSSPVITGLDDVSRKFTPRTNIAAFLGQAPEVTPVTRVPLAPAASTEGPTAASTDGPTASLNASAFALNEVGVSMLARSSAGGAGFDQSAGEKRGKGRTKKHNLDIHLPEVTPRSRHTANLSVSSGHQQAQSPREEEGPENEPEGEITNSASLGRKSTPSPIQRERERPPDDLTPSQNTVTTDETGHPTDGGALEAGSTERDSNRSGDRNIFSDVFGPDLDRTGRAGSDDDMRERDVSSALGDAGEQGSGMSLLDDNNPQFSPSVRAGSEQSVAYSAPTAQNVAVDSEPGSGNCATTPDSTAVLHQKGAKRTIEDLADVSSTPSKRRIPATSPLSQETVSSPRRSKRNGQTPSHSSSPAPSLQKSPASCSVSHDSASHGSKSLIRKSLLKSGGEKSLFQVDSNQQDVTAVKGPDTPRLSVGPLDSASPVPPFRPEMHSQTEGTPLQHGSRIRRPRTSTPRPNRLSGDRQEDTGETQSASSAAAFRMSSVHHDGQSEEEEERTYSPLKTPRLPEKPATPAAKTPGSVRRSIGVISEAAGKGAKAGGRKGTGPSRPARKTAGGLPTSVVKATFTHFCRLRVSKEAIEEVEKISEQYWKNIAEDLEAYATHAHRKTIDETDVHLLMQRQGFVTDKCSLNTLIATYLPLEQRQELIPIARSGNKVEPYR